MALEIGRQFGRVKVIANVTKMGVDLQQKYKCLCDCGIVRVIDRTSLYRVENSTYCNYCKPKSIKERLLASSIPEPNSGCWIWLGGLSKDSGYGNISINGVSVKAHRVSFEEFVRPIPAGKEVCHSCDFPPCINPEHLFVGSHFENMQDRDRKQRRKAPVGVTNGFSILTDEDVRGIRVMLQRRTETQEEIGRLYGISGATVSLIKKGKRWSHVV